MSCKVTLASWSLVALLSVGFGSGASECGGDGGASSCSDGGGMGAETAGVLGVSADPSDSPRPFADLDLMQNRFTADQLASLGERLRSLIDRGEPLAPDDFHALVDNLDRSEYVLRSIHSPLGRALAQSERWRRVSARGFAYTRAYLALILAKTVPTSASTAESDFDLPAREVVRLAGKLLARDLTAAAELPTDDLYEAFARLRDLPELRGAAVREQFTRAAALLDTALVSETEATVRWRLAVMSNRNVLKVAAAGFGFATAGTLAASLAYPEHVQNAHVAVKQLLVAAPLFVPILAGAIHCLVEHVRRDRALAREHAQIRVIAAECGRILTAPSI